MKTIPFILICFLIFVSCEKKEDSPASPVTPSSGGTNSEIKLRIDATNQYGSGSDQRGIRGTVTNQSSFTVYNVQVKATTNDAARTVDVSPNSLLAGQNGSFDTGYMLSRNGSFPSLIATGSK